jgi:hypothetical protein
LYYYHIIHYERSVPPPSPQTHGTRDTTRDTRGFRGLTHMPGRCERAWRARAPSPSTSSPSRPKFGVRLRPSQIEEERRRRA